MELVSCVRAVKKFKSKDIKAINIEPFIIVFEKLIVFDLKLFEIKYPKREYKITVNTDDKKRCNIFVN